MSNFDDDEVSDREYHNVPFHRIWMDGEYVILTKKQLVKEKRKWKHETVS